MPRATLSHKLPEEAEEFRMASTGADAHLVLWEVGQEIFRPARKHGYSDPRIAELMTKIPDGLGEDLVSLLEEKFYEILRERGVELD